MRILQVDTVREGLTDPRIWQLTHDDVAIAGTGLTLTSVSLESVDGQTVDTAGKFTWSDQDAGHVQYAPDTDDFQLDKSPYRLCVVLTDGAGKTRGYPDGFVAEIHVIGVPV